MIITLLGGAGFMGAGIVRDLVSDRTIIDITAIRLCDASREKMEALANELGDPRITLVDAPSVLGHRGAHRHGGDGTQQST